MGGNESEKRRATLLNIQMTVTLTITIKIQVIIINIKLMYYTRQTGLSEAIAIK